MRLARPFYLPLAGAGVTEMPEKLRRDLVRASRKVTGAEVRELLAGGWRETVVGGWLALALPVDEVRDAVLAAMARSTCDEAALPLSVVSTLVAGPAAVEAIESHLEPAADDLHDDSELQIVAAAVARCGGVPRQVPPTWAIEAFDDMVSAAQGLQQAFRTARA